MEITVQEVKVYTPVEEKEETAWERMVNGFKDRVYMTKYDDAAIHPDANGMSFMSRKIYTELGTWLEE